MLENSNNNLQKNVNEININNEKSADYDDEYDILVGSGDEKDVNSETLSSFQDQIQNIVGDKTIEKRNLMIEESKLRLQKKMDELDDLCANKLENNEKYKNAKKSCSKAKTAVLGAAALLVTFPVLAPFLATAIGAMVVIAIKKHSEAEKIAKKIRKQFDNEKKLIQVQEQINNMNNPELQRLNNEYIEKYVPKKIEQKVENLKRIKSMNEKLSKISKKIEIESNKIKNNNKKEVVNEQKIDDKSVLKAALNEQNKNNKEKTDLEKQTDKNNNINIDKLVKNKQVKEVTNNDKNLKQSINKLNNKHNNVSNEKNIYIDMRSKDDAKLVPNSFTKRRNEFSMSI